MKNTPGIRLMVVLFVAALLMLAAALSAKADDRYPWLETGKHNAQAYQAHHVDRGRVRATKKTRALERAHRRAKQENQVVEYAQPISSSGLVAKAEAYIGQTAAQVGVRRSLWCAAFVNKVLGGGTGSDLSTSYKRYGQPASRGCVGCIAVTSRRGGAGHVGIVKGWDGNNAVIISGNHNRRVGVGVYASARIVALRWP